MVHGIDESTAAARSAGLAIGAAAVHATLGHGSTNSSSKLGCEPPLQPSNKAMTALACFMAPRSATGAPKRDSRGYPQSRAATATSASGIYLITASRGDRFGFDSTAVAILIAVLVASCMKRCALSESGLAIVIGTPASPPKRI